MVDASERLQRLLRALPIIASRDGIPIDDMPAVAGVDARTLIEDLRALTERDDEPGGFVEAVSILIDSESVSITTPHFQRPTRITLPELCALELGLAILAGSSTRSDRAVVDRARARVRQAIVAMPETAGRDDLWYASGPTVHDESVLEVLRRSVADKTKATIDYQKADSTESTKRIVHPYAVVPLRGKWFLVAHCERSSSVRFFRIDRVRAAARLTATFDVPSDLPAEALANLSGDRALVSPASERLVVRYSVRIARWIAEREEGEHGTDGSYLVSHPLADDAWAVRHVLQYGPEAEVVAPARVRERVASTLRAMSSDRSARSGV
jgi:predicted DNA-binding transcriptional regulator YafY